jgi:hypothetical protein
VQGAVHLSSADVTVKIENLVYVAGTIESRSANVAYEVYVIIGMFTALGHVVAAEVAVKILVAVRVAGAGQVCVAIVADQVAVRIVMRASVIVVCVVIVVRSAV